MTASGNRVLIVDLNNFARYPTLAVGYLVSALREGGFDVDLLSPLASRLSTLPERRERVWDHMQRRVYFSSPPALIGVRNKVASARRRWVTRPDPRLAAAAREAIDERRPDVVLLSAYLDYGAAALAIADVANARGTPVLIGGPAFNMPEVAEAWRDFPAAAIVAAEVDRSLPRLVEAVIAGDDLLGFPGVYLPDGRSSARAQPLTDLVDLPTPDLTDFPWHLYPNKVIPVMTGRGCSWGHCTFCSDVKVVNGLTFRSRPVEDVLGELQEQCARYSTQDVIFLDIKLNSNLAMWRGIIENFQRLLPGGKWIGTVHVQASGENGLDAQALREAAQAGLTRISFGLETGSPRVNRLMAKGTDIERTSQFLHDARSAGISVRATAINGYPGETAEDIGETVRFLETHGRLLDRIRMNRFTPLPGTRFHELYNRRPERFELTELKWDYRLRRGEYRYGPAAERRYRKARARLLRSVHRINRRPLQDSARVFDGLM
jgi:anaerobic magnesium-protoporphyrin IX monomethyl ester cyclase